MITGRVKKGTEIFQVLIEDGKIYEATGDVFNGLVRTDHEFNRDDVTFLAPVIPGKIMAVGKNYYAHVKEFDSKIPTSPIIFMKLKFPVIFHCNKKSIGTASAASMGFYAFEKHSFNQ